MLAACAKREEPEVAQEEAPEAAAEKAPEAVGGGRTLTVVDLSPLNWLSVTWMTMEELVRVDKDGHTVPTLASEWQWSDDKRNLTFNLRKGVTFQDGEKFDARVFRRSFDEVQKWKSPHPPGAFLNFDPKTKLEVLDDYSVRFTFPEPDAGALMKFRGMHVGSTRFWDQGGFVNKKTGTAEGHW
jgi:ABC-type transport system substrate-binding protein